MGGDEQPRQALFVLFGTLATVAFVIGISYMQWKPSLTDSIAYLQASRQLAGGRGLAFVDSHNRINASYYTLHGFKVYRGSNSNRFLDYPPGLPLLGATLIFFTGDADAAQLASPIAAAVLILATCILGASLFDPWTGIWAGLALFQAETFLQFSSALWSEIPAAALLFSGVAVYVGVQRRQARSVMCFAAGFLVAASCFVRLSNLSAIVPIVLLGLLDGLNHQSRRHVAVAFVIGILVCISALPVFNLLYYGGMTVTAYSPLHGWYAQPAFSLDYAFGTSFAVVGARWPLVRF